ncbi:peptide/nickel transport system ATP-binding protein/oligopeptide transport system ATP-binding protein [Desulfobaculum xiamenense]|uniref:Peptide/nickel transport system ATP-binding protein/oligopeptide transport system ATP-binding protein n=1 Tax=Desulfobaculum xiamenense TaxID=995050 RepID=A0A846QWL8_9BACT|nr:ABC transporter ATP-binding protein [Desulfobaculum xiamenense]NJB69009.1 peptide/nickel transport system ATP-binding protein/oligopeptide transport system ATP-binding protein [Desulfobaculum xiamenense]
MQLLDVRDLRTHFFTAHGVAKAVDGVTLSVAPGETMAIVGESGCGKTMLALSVLRLVPSPPGRIVGGDIRFDGRDILALDEEEMRSIRGNSISMIFQEPMSSLNPVFRVGEQIAEALRLHQRMGRREALAAAVDLLHMVGIPEPASRARSYPHEMSGGMRQRVVIAMALACDPRLVLADEPTTALDVTIQAQILDLMMELRERRNAAIVFITHDLGVVAQTCTRVAVMYAGRIVEESPVRDLFREPLHPYTKGLMRSVPRIDRTERLVPVSGMVPNLVDLPQGCHFNPRCPHAFDRCREELPPLTDLGAGRRVRCWLHA